MKTLNEVKKLAKRSSTVIYKRIKILNITPEYRHNPKGPATLVLNDIDALRVINYEAKTGRPKGE